MLRVVLKPFARLSQPPQEKGDVFVIQLHSVKPPTDEEVGLLTCVNDDVTCVNDDMTSPV